jgi:hypothetical protein
VTKHKLRVSGDEKTNEFFNKLSRSIRNKVLQKLVLIYWNLWWREKNELHQTVEKRLNGLPHDGVNFAYCLKPEDVMPIIGCSRRTAIEYIDALKILMD